jgi:hypothetical protein
VSTVGHTDNRVVIDAPLEREIDFPTRMKEFAVAPMRGGPGPWD